MIEIHKDNSTEVSELCIKSVVDIWDQIHNARLNPYNIYGKCYTFEENDINQTSSFRQLQAGQTRPGGLSVEDYTPWWGKSYLSKEKILKSSPPCSSGQPIAEFLN